jgi:hypothetical protein
VQRKPASQQANQYQERQCLESLQVDSQEWQQAVKKDKKKASKQSNKNVSKQSRKPASRLTRMPASSQERQKESQHAGSQASKKIARKKQLASEKSSQHVWQKYSHKSAGQ